MGGAAAMGHRAGTRSAQAAEQEQEQNEQIQQLQAQQAPAAPAAPAAAPGGGDADQMAKLTQLAALRQQGLINDQEYSAAKAKLLGI
jgi:hypothetical protein